ncbi:MAG: HAMP domain-containing protein, partial [Proteobacteria bacterium]|nr:HAMP domain-containing protein [Pseudomonadota bacterium]
MKLLSRLPLAPKLLIVALLLMAPLGVTLAILLGQWRGQVAAAARFQDAVALEDAVTAALPGVMGHRSATVLLALGDHAMAEKLATDGRSADTALAALSARHDSVGATVGGRDAVAALATRWAALRARDPDPQANASKAAHDELARGLITLAGRIGEAAGFALDDDPASVFLLRVLSGTLLETANDLSQVRLLASTMAAGGAEPGARDRLIALMAANEERDLALKATLGHALAGREAGLQPLVAAIRDYDRTADGFRTVVRARLIATAATTEAAREVASRYAEAKKAEFALYEAASAAARAALADRIRSAYLRIALSLAGILALTVLALAIGWRVRLALVRQLAAARGAFARIEAGDFTTALVPETEDEAGAVVAALERMQTNLRASLERDRALARENARVRTALDHVSTPALLCDPAGQVVYRNDAAQALFAARAAALRSVDPAFDPARLVGADLRRWYPLPAGLSGAHVAEHRVGDASFRIIANPVVEAGGAAVGIVVQWLDRTDEVATEGEIGAIVERALEGDLTRRIATDGKSGFFGSLALGVNRLLDNVTEMVRAVTAAAVEVRAGADEIARGNANLSERTEHQASSLEETASSMEEMTSTVRQNA